VLYREFVEKLCVDLLDLLTFFPSCRPTIVHLADLITTISPRYYSVVSSPLTDPRVVRFAFSVVDFTVNDDEGRRKGGLCTSYLEGLCSPFLAQVRAPSEFE